MKFGVLVFPGSNCDTDCRWAAQSAAGAETVFIWHKERSFKDIDCIIIPGGFSYGDYLRTGAIARFSPIMDYVKDYLQDGGFAIGICNGFQILLEAGLLPGAMLRNKGLQFVCKYVHLKVETTDTPFTSMFTKGDIIRMPIAHGEGNWTGDSAAVKDITHADRVVLRYCSPQGEVSDAWNPNGSMQNIAGICNDKKNIFGLMPHPERACQPQLGSSDGLKIFQSIINHIETIR